MQRIEILLGKIGELAKNGDKNTEIEVDLMMDYTRVLYADLLQLKNSLAFRSSVPTATSAPVKTAPEIQQQEKHTLHLPKTPAALPSSPKFAKDIRGRIGINDKLLIINELFENDKDIYEEVLNEINSFENFDDAIQWLKNTVATKYGWRTDNETVELFYGILNAFFSTW